MERHVTAYRDLIIKIYQPPHPNQSITVISVKILAGLRRKKIVRFNGKDAK